MPSLSGAEVLSELLEKRYVTRVAMVTAVDPGFDIIEMPFDDYVIKPVSKAELFETIEQLLLYANYEERLRECYSLTAKYAALESSKPQNVLEESDEFAELQADLSEVRTVLDEITDSFDATDFELLFRDFETGDAMSDSTRS
jgi:DNA-binding response OmpR family regulator